MAKTTQCPRCNAELPPKGRFCLECGCDLYGEGLRRPPLPWLPGLLVLAAVAGIAAVLLVRSRGPALPPEERLVREMTRELLQLAADGNYGEIVRRFHQPNEPEYAQVGAALREIVRGRGTPGLNLFRATCMDNHDEARKLVDRYHPQDPDYVVAVLTAIAFQDGALRTTLGGTLVGAQRTEEFCAWHLGLAFRGVDARNAQIESVQWQDGSGAERRLAVAIRYPEAPATMPGLIDPTLLSWRWIREGTWALTFPNRLNAEEVLKLLEQIKL